MGIWRDFDDLRERLGGVAQDESDGDNLAILLASYFEPGIEDDELDESETWKLGALDKADAVLAAIHAHYAPTLEAERTARKAAEEEIVSLRARAEKAEKDLVEARLKLFPYADAPTITGLSWNGFYLIGDQKSIKELKRLENRSSQLEVFSAAFDERIKAATARAERLEAALAATQARVAAAESTSAEILKTNAELVASLGKMGGEIAELVDALREARDIQASTATEASNVPLWPIDSILARYGKGQG